MFKRIDFYVLRQVFTPLLLTLVVSAMLLLLERMLRLFDMVANLGGPVGVVFQMLGNLIPQYVGMALPLGLFLGILLAFRKLSESSELDAFQASGLSLWRLMRAPLALSMVLTVVSVALLGFVQPRSYYAYQSLLFELSSGAFGASIRPGEYSDLGDGFTLRIERAQDDGSRLIGVFAQKERPNGHITTITAEEGTFLATPDGTTILLRLHDGVIVDVEPDRPAPRVFTFQQHDWPLQLPTVTEFRERGGKERELTLPELWIEARATADPAEARRYSAAFWDRTLRSLGMLILPFMAVGLAIGAKRQQRQMGLVVGVVALLVYHKMLEFGAASVGLGSTSLFTALFMPTIIFALLAAFFFHTAAYRVGVSPLAWIEAGWEYMVGLLGRIRIGRTADDEAEDAPSSQGAAS